MQEIKNRIEIVEDCIGGIRWPTRRRLRNEGLSCAGRSAFADEVPYVVALVTLEEGPQMMMNIVGCPPEKVEIGMPVEATFDKWTEEIAFPKFQPV